MTHVAWNTVVKHAAKQIEEARDALERADLERIATIQARIGVWREVINLPSTLTAPPISEEKSTYA